MLMLLGLSLVLARCEAKLSGRSGPLIGYSAWSQMRR
uniref:Uncharacterized protein n=1 Tax=Arundo donax TaxID=35708 RepID=A0A0A9FN08_ARUDO